MSSGEVRGEKAGFRVPRFYSCALVWCSAACAASAAAMLSYIVPETERLFDRQRRPAVIGSTAATAAVAAVVREYNTRVAVAPPLGGCGRPSLLPLTTHTLSSGLLGLMRALSCEAQIMCASSWSLSLRTPCRQVNCDSNEEVWVCTAYTSRSIVIG